MKNIRPEFIPLVIIPIFLLHKILGNGFFVSNNYDPDYSYLFNGLRILNGELPWEAYHPGTPVQFLVAFFLGLLFFLKEGALFFSNTALMNDEIILASQEYATQTEILLFFTNLIFLIWAVKLLKTVIANKTLISLLGYSLIFPTILTNINGIRPEFSLFVATLFFTYSVIRAANSNSLKSAIFCGIALGFGASIKLALVPAAILFLAFNGKKRQFASFFISIISIFVFSILIKHRFYLFTNWLGALILRKGNYGSGGFGLIEASSIFQNLSKIFYKEPFFIILTLYASYTISIRLIKKIRSGQSIIKIYTEMPPLKRLLYLCPLLALMQIFLCSKLGAAHYLITAFPALSFYLSKDISKSPRIIIIPAAIFMIFSIQSHFRTQSAKSDEVKIIDSLVSQKKCIVAHYFGSSSENYALSFGNGHSNYYFTKHLHKLFEGNGYPHLELTETGFARYKGNKIIHIDKEILEKINSEKKCVLLRGYEFMRDSRAFFSWVKTEPLFKGDHGYREGLYLATGLK